MRGPPSSWTASPATKRPMLAASDAPSVAEQIATGVPSAVPNSSPDAPARIGPGNMRHVSAAAHTMKTSGATAPKPSTQSSTFSGESDPDSARTRNSDAERQRQHRQADLRTRPAAADPARLARRRARRDPAAHRRPA